jgi:hypothetical protein
MFGYVCGFANLSVSCSLTGNKSLRQAKNLGKTAPKTPAAKLNVFLTNFYVVCSECERLLALDADHTKPMANITFVEPDRLLSAFVKNGSQAVHAS